MCRVFANTFGRFGFIWASYYRQNEVRIPQTVRRYRSFERHADGGTMHSDTALSCGCTEKTHKNRLIRQVQGGSVGRADSRGIVTRRPSPLRSPDHRRRRHHHPALIISSRPVRPSVSSNRTTPCSRTPSSCRLKTAVVARVLHCLSLYGMVQLQVWSQRSLSSSPPVITAVDVFIKNGVKWSGVRGTATHGMCLQGRTVCNKSPINAAISAQTPLELNYPPNSRV